MKDLKWANAEVVLVSIICSCVKNLNVNFKYNNTLLRTIVLCYCPNFFFFFPLTRIWYRGSQELQSNVTR